MGRIFSEENQTRGDVRNKFLKEIMRGFLGRKESETHYFDVHRFL